MRGAEQFYDQIMQRLDLTKETEDEELQEIIRCVIEEEGKREFLSLGEKNQDMADRAANTGIFLSLCSFVVFALIGIFLSRFFIEYIKNPQEEFERHMSLMMGQWLSIPFIVAGVVMIVYGLRHEQHPTPLAQVQALAAEREQREQRQARQTKKRKK